MQSITEAVPQRKDLERLIQERVTPPYQQPLLGLIRPAILLRTVPVSEATLPLGSSKIGGLPYFSAGAFWPQSPYEEQPMWFVAQINLSEVKCFDEEGLLPPQVILYFFAYYDVGTVLYESNSDQSLQRSESPQETKPGFWKRLLSKKKQRMHYPSCQLTLTTEYTYPSHDSHYLERLQVELGTELPPIQAFNDSFWDTYEQINEENDTISCHQLLGYAKGMQDEYFEGEIAYRSTIGKDEKPPDYEQLTRWVLLFQLDSDRNSNMCWADWGRVYFFIERERLAKADFSNVRVTVQSY